MKYSVLITLANELDEEFIVEAFFTVACDGLIDPCGVFDANGFPEANLPADFWQQVERKFAARKQSYEPIED